MNNNFNTPIISLHIPKCGGSSLHNIFFKYLIRYFNIHSFYPDIGVNLPHDWKQERTIIHGHFVRWQNQSVEDVCPDTPNYITILRDPYDVCVSAYHYGRKTGAEWAKISFPNFIDWWAQNSYGPLLGALPIWEKSESLQDFINKFILIGSLNHFDKYIESISKIFSIEISELVKTNVSDEKLDLPNLRHQLIEAHPRDFELFNHVNDIYNSL
jgi:hypothetical protein